MRALLQRVSQASVEIDQKTTASIASGLLILLGIEDPDTEADIAWLCQKISQMRIFPDDSGKMNHSLLDTGGQALVVSQFTLHASTKKGNRPSFLKAAHPDKSEPLYQSFCKALETSLGKPVPTGTFGAEMQIHLTNSGPVTIWLDSKDKE